MENELIAICKQMVEQQKRASKALFIALIVSICVNAFLVVAFLYYEAGYNFSGTTVTTEQSTTDDSSIVNGDQYNDGSQNRSD